MISDMSKELIVYPVIVEKDGNTSSVFWVAKIPLYGAVNPCLAMGSGNTLSEAMHELGERMQELHEYVALASLAERETERE